MTKRILIMAAGTGGHVFPALAVAKALMAQGVDVAWLGTPSGMESEWVAAANIPFYSITVSGLRGGNFKKMIMAPWQILGAIAQSWQIIRALKPNAVLGMGGYVSGPGGIAAWLLRKPLIIHEQNTIAGLTNRLLTRFSTILLESFPNTFKKQHRRLVTTGNPVREEIAALPSPDERFAERFAKEPKEPLRILVLGGSRGASVINNIMPLLVAQLTASATPIRLWHQTGKNDFSKIQAAYGSCDTVRVNAFIENMAEAYEWADIVIGRAGATTLAELATVGLGSILIPYPHAADDHQTHNANYFQQQGAALVLAQSVLTTEALTDLLRPLLEQRGTLLTMANRACRLKKAQATDKIVRECLGASGD